MTSMTHASSAHATRPWQAEVAVLRVTLVSEAGAEAEPVSARAVHAALLRLVEQRDSFLSDAVHKASFNPIAIWPDEPACGHAPAHSTNRQSWLIGLLHHRVTAVFTEALIEAAVAGESIALDWQRFRIAAVTPAGPALTYAELLARAQPDSELSLRFITPVIVSRKSDTLRSPEPRLIFGGLLKRWNALSGAPLDLNEPTIVARVHLGETHLAHVDRELFNHPFIGFAGTASFRIDGDDAFRQGVCALAAYVRFCGTGAKTAMGMGRTERID